MDNKRPRAREKNVTGPAKTVKKRGAGLGTGPVGDAGGYKDRPQPGRAQPPDRPRPQSSGTRSAVVRGGGMMKLIIILAVLLLGGGGGLTAMFGGQPEEQSAPTDQPQYTQQPAYTPQSQSGGSAGWANFLNGLGGSVSSGWQGQANTGRLDTSVARGSREKYTALLGGGKDTATIMVYMCGTDLESRSGMGTADLQEMLDASLGKNINLLVYTGGCKAWKNTAVSSSTNQIWQVRDGQLLKLQDSLGSVPMTSTDTLSGYIQWCRENYPASRYGLILWDHGGGSVSGYGYDEKFASSGSMSLAGLDTALGDAGVKFDFIGFDACLMATVETALTLSQYADYLIASEETEPGVGWYYTDWLTAFGKDPSMPTIEIGQRIADSFVDTCAQKCRGQLTTLSVVDLAELEHTLPDALDAFSSSTAKLIREQEYQQVSDARSEAREFAQSSRIDQVDLVHLAQNLDTEEARSLASALLGAVKYNRTSSNMTNAYGLSVYFPYRTTATVDKAVATFERVGIDKSYTQCIRQFADVAASGQAVSGSSGSPLPALLGMLGGQSGGDISALLGELLGGRGLDTDEMREYLEANRFDAGRLSWSENEDGAPVLSLSEEQWALVQSLELNLFYDDGEGYIDLGLDNVFSFDDYGRLLGKNDNSWLAINGQPVAYYHTVTVDDGDSYTITGRVPALHNGVRAELILVFDNDSPKGYVAGIQPVYHEGETETIAKSLTGIEPGDRLEFLCDYYSYEGDYQDSYLLGEPLEVGGEGLTISDVPLEGGALATYRFTDIYDQHYWTQPVPDSAGEE